MALKLTIRARLSLLFALSAVLTLMVFSIFIYYFTQQYRTNEFRQRLKNRLVEADSLLRRNSAYPFITLEHLPPGTLPEEAFHYRKPQPDVTISEGGSTVRLGTLNEVQENTYFFTEKGKRSYIVYFDGALRNVIVLSAVDEFGYSKLANLKNLLVLGVILGSLLLGFVSWYLPRRELQPLADKIKKARRIGGQNLNLRLNVRNDHDELGQLAITFNQMLDRIATAFDAQKRFTSNAAHELRNPITAISGEAQLALSQSRNAEEYRGTLERIRTKSEDLKKLVERLLILARIETGQSGKVPVRIDEVLLDSVSSLQSRHPERTKSIRLHIEESESEYYTVNGDAVMLQVAVDNIIENALKYGEGKPVSIGLSRSQEGVLLQVSDEGMGVRAEDQDKLFQLFFRASNALHIEGIGVGLPLVKSITDWHGGTIAIEPNVPAGTRVTVTLPAGA